MKFFISEVGHTFSLSQSFLGPSISSLMIVAGQGAPREQSPATSDLGNRMRKLRNCDLYFSRPDFRSVVDQ